jgi:acyl-CoA synthetase (AMP-forming)/AMP-acid ligase II
MLLDMACDGFGDRTVVGRSHDGLTPVDLRRRARAGAQVLRDRQAPALVYLDVNGPAYPVAMFAAAHAGVPLVPINYRLGGEQLDYLLGQHPGALAIVAPDSAAHVASLGLTTMTTDEWLAVTDQADNEQDPDWSDEAAIVIYTRTSCPTSSGPSSSQPLTRPTRPSSVSRPTTSRPWPTC